MNTIIRYWFVQPILLVMCCALQHSGNGPWILFADIMQITCILLGVVIVAYFLCKRNIRSLMVFFICDIIAYCIFLVFKVPLLQNPLGRKTLVATCSGSPQEAMDKGTYKWDYRIVPSKLEINENCVISFTAAFAENAYQHASYNQNDSRIIINDTIYKVVLCVDSVDWVMESGFGKEWTIEGATYPWAISKTYRSCQPPDTIVLYVQLRNGQYCDNWEYADSIMLYRNTDGHVDSF